MSMLPLTRTWNFTSMLSGSTNATTDVYGAGFVTSPSVGSSNSPFTTMYFVFGETTAMPCAPCRFGIFTMRSASK